MLVKFNSSTAGEILMFADAARRLLEIAGKERTARGVFTKEQLPAAIACLRRAVSEEKPLAHEENLDEDEERRAPPPVGLAQRAYPLIELMERTLKDDGYLLWEAPQDF